MTNKMVSNMIDFEQAIVATFDNVYSGLPVKGCFTFAKQCSTMSGVKSWMYNI